MNINTPEPLRVMVADDHALVRGGLALMVKMVEEDAEILETNDYNQTLDALSAEDAVDLLLLDLLMPGMELTKGVKTICDTWPDLPVIVISVKEDTGTIREALQSGALGYIPKTSSPNVTTMAIRLVLSGGVYVPPHVLRGPSADDVVEPPAPVDDAAQFGLTRRQKDVLDLMAQGMSNKAIASELGLTPGTVKMHTSRLFRSLNVENRTEAVAKYTQMKLDRR